MTSHQEELPLSQHDMLDLDDCVAIAQRVLALERHWTVRSPGSFYTLGAASYLDAPDRHEAYLAAAQATNPLLRREFADAHEQVREFFEEWLGDAVFYNSDCALPGFHVFVTQGGEPARDEVAQRAHFDMQWEHAIPGRVPQGTLSFTLPIEIPKGGASMAVWPARYQDAVRLGFSARSYAATHPCRLVEYEPGRIVVHDGWVLHAIGPSPGPRGYRITLQGHGVRTPDGWMLYW